MFSHNQKISPRQMKSFLILDWLARLCLMLPVCLAGRSLGTMVGCLAAGFLFWVIFAGLIVRVSEDEHDFFELLSRRIGTVGAWLVYIAGLFYFLVYTTVCINLCANLASVYLLPEVPLPVLAALPLAAGLYLAAGTVEIQGRLSELTVPVVLVLFLFMAALDAAGMNLVPGVEHRLLPDKRLAAGSYEVFACMGGMFLPVLLPCLSAKRNTVGLLRRAAAWSILPAGILLFITASSFGTAGMFQFEFPTVRVMSNVTVPGGFIQRWDVFFLMLLLFSLAFSVGSSLWALNEVTGRLWQEAAGLKWKIMLETGEKKWQTVSETEKQKWWEREGIAGGWQEELAGELTEFQKERISADDNLPAVLWVIRGLIIFVIFWGAAGFRSPEAAINYYRAFNLYLLTPFMIFVYILLYFRGCRRKTKKAGMLFGILCILLTGCTARELEDRIFPMALELRMEGEQLVMIYAWNGEEASGSGGGGKGQEEEETEEKEKTEGKEQTQEMEDSKKGKRKEEKTTDSGTDGQGGNETETGDGTGFSLQAEPVEQGNLTIFRGSTLSGILQQVEEYSDRYMDYSHVKAVILDETLEEYPELEREVYEWFAREPAFAASLIIYPAQESGLSLVQADERSDGKIGDYLENLYENNRKLQGIAVTLGKKTSDLFG